MTSLASFVRPMVPVNSFSQRAIVREKVAPDPDVGIRWGRQSVLTYQIDNPSSTQPPANETTGAVIDDDETVNRYGVGVRATDELPESPLFITKYFDCGLLDDYKEERKTLVTGVTVIQPIITTYHVFFKLDFIPSSAVISSRVEQGFDEQFHNSQINRALTRAEWEFEEELPRRFLGEPQGPKRRWHYVMSGASPK